MYTEAELKTKALTEELWNQVQGTGYLRTQDARETPARREETAGEMGCSEAVPITWEWEEEARGGCWSTLPWQPDELG